MNRRLLISAFSVSLLLSTVARARDDEPIDKLIERANSGGDHKAELFARVARREVDIANDDFTRGDVQHAYEAVKAVSEYSDKALQAARQYRKKLKETEITLRETSRRLNDVEQTLAFEDRPLVKQVIEHVEDVRSDLLHLMFEPDVRRQNSFQRGP
jgi:hypothetical protein